MHEYCAVQNIRTYQEQMRKGLADLELQEDEIVQLLHMTENPIGQKIHGFVDRDGLIEARRELEKEMKEVRGKIDASKVENRELNDEIGREVETRIEEFEEQACILGFETPKKIKERFRHVRRGKGRTLNVDE